MVDPTQSVDGAALTLVMVGSALTVTAEVVDVALVQPAPAYVTARLYPPLPAVVVAVNDGAAVASLKPFGPVQLYVGVPVPATPLALRLIVDPTHSVDGTALTLVIVGSAFT